MTSNLKDFPASKLPAGLQVLSPAEFALNTVSIDPIRSREAIRTIAKRSGHRGETWTADDVLAHLEARYGMTAAVELLRG